MANIARCKLSGNGGTSEWPLTKWTEGTAIRSSRPGSASALVGMLFGLENIGRLWIDLCRALLTRQTVRAADAGDEIPSGDRREAAGGAAQDVAEVRGVDRLAVVADA